MQGIFPMATDLLKGDERLEGVHRWMLSGMSPNVEDTLDRGVMTSRAAMPSPKLSW